MTSEDDIVHFLASRMRDEQHPARPGDVNNRALRLAAYLGAWRRLADDLGRAPSVGAVAQELGLGRPTAYRYNAEVRRLLGGNLRSGIA